MFSLFFEVDTYRPRDLLRESCVSSRGLIDDLQGRGALGCGEMFPHLKTAMCLDQKPENVILFLEKGCSVRKGEKHDKESTTKNCKMCMFEENLMLSHWFQHVSTSTQCFGERKHQPLRRYDTQDEAGAWQISPRCKSCFATASRLGF